jgi:hypothetical protein
MKRRRPSKVICQLDVVHNLPTKLPQKLLNEKSLLFTIETYSKSSKHQKMAPSAFLDQSIYDRKGVHVHKRDYQQGINSYKGP